jgi:hypothetical protein
MSRAARRARAFVLVAGIVAAVLLVLALSGCEDSSGYDPHEPGGFGVTYRGKPGIDLGGGIVLDPGKGTVAPGFGF